MSTMTASELRDLASGDFVRSNNPKQVLRLLTAYCSKIQGIQASYTEASTGVPYVRVTYNSQVYSILFYRRLNVFAVMQNMPRRNQYFDKASDAVKFITAGGFN